MMKSILISMAVLASTTIFAEPVIIIPPDYFSGFYIGGNVSVHSLTSNQSTEFLSSNNVTIASYSLLLPPGVQDFDIVMPAGLLATSEADVGATDIYGGLQGGWGKVFNNHWYLGAVGFGEWGKQEANNQNVAVIPKQFLVVASNDEMPPLPINQVSIVGNNSIGLSTNTEIKNDYGAAAKLGYLFTPSTLLYGKIGAEWADINISSSVSGSANSTISQIALSHSEVINNSVTLSGSNSNSKTNAALLLGIGMEQFVYSNIVSLSLEYDYADFGSVSTSGPVNIHSVTTGSVTTQGTTTPLTPQVVDASLANALSASSDAKISTFLLGLNVYFGKNWF